MDLEGSGVEEGRAHLELWSECGEGGRGKPDWESTSCYSL